MPAARVADRSPMAAHLLVRESARGVGCQQQQNGRKDSLPMPPQQQQQHKEHEQPELEQDQDQQQMNALNAADKSEEQCRQEKELCARLMANRDQLEEQLIARLEQLKDICVAEGELIGQLPTEIYKCLLPGETEPTVKRRVGTAFKFPQELLAHRQQNFTLKCDDGGEPNEGRQLFQLEAEIELNRRIVAAAERLAKDKSVNKSVRKKRRKDLQLAAQRLRGLEKGLHRMRLSSSKPDVSSMAMADGSAAAPSSASIGHQSGSGFSLNSLKAWPNFYHTLRMSNTKSCPATPRGSVPDLSSITAVASVAATATAPRADDATTNGDKSGENGRKTTPSTAKKLHKMLSRDQLLMSTSVHHPAASAVSVPMCQQHSPEVPPSSSSSSSLISGASSHHHPSSSSGISSGAHSLSSSSNLLLLPPPVPSRRSSSGSSSSSVSVCAGGDGRRPTPAAPQQNGVTTNGGGAQTNATDDETSPGRTKRHSDNNLYANIGYLSSSPYKSAYRQCHFPTMLQQQKSPPVDQQQRQPMTSSTSFSATLKDFAASRHGCSSSSSSSSTASLAAAASTQMGQIVRRLDAAPNPLRLAAPLAIRRCAGGTPNDGGIRAHGQTHSTGSLDRRLRRAAPTTTSTMMKKMPSATAFCAPGAAAFHHQLSPPALQRTTAVEQLTSTDRQQQQQQPHLITTFPALITSSDRCGAGGDNGTANQLLEASTRFRSISAVLCKSARGSDLGEMCFPRPNDRMEALLAAIHRQSKVGSICSDISSSNGTTTSAQSDGGTSTTTTLV